MRRKHPPPEVGHENSAHDKVKCVLCRNRQEFELPKHLLKQLTTGNVVIFAGAGISTESSTVFSWTLYEEIHKDLGLNSKEKPSFPRLMSLYCKRPDGRRNLLTKIRARLAYVQSFPELYRMATRFHRELATLFYVDTYVTTNWDDYFENECGATPFVSAEDFAFWNTRGRKVFKLHGSISNYGSVVATDEDYQNAQEQLARGSLGSALKLMLATKTIIYVGYSFSDYDFSELHKYIFQELRQVAPTAYIVSLDRSAESRFRSLGLTPIFTDATHFIEVLKEHLECDGHFLPDKRLGNIPFALARARAEHRRLHEHFRASETPNIVYCASYQDGLIHAFERVLARSHTGEYSHGCDVGNQLRHYEKIRKDNLHRRSYFDVAYVEGYMNGLVYVLGNDRERARLPFYFLYGVADQPTTLKQFEKWLPRAGSRHKAAAALAKRIAEGLGPGDEAHHRPFLNWNLTL